MIYKQNCGCEFELNLEEIQNFAPDKPIQQTVDYIINNDVIPPLYLNLSNFSKLPNCNKTWQLFHNGYTKGIFQLETQLGQTWTKKLKPNSIEDISALISIVRPGVLDNIVDGCSLTEHFCRRKNKQEEVPPYHPVYDDILKETYGIMVYQEQIMEVCRRIAGFDLKQADVIRKATGKKDAKIMAECEKMFAEGCEKTKIVTKEQALQIFEWIKASARYSFNKSHGVSYAIGCYTTAYFKSHFPVEFYTAWLIGAKEKQKPRQAMYEIINEAKLMNIETLIPDLRDLQKSFYTNGKSVKFGLQDIKGIGESQVAKLIGTIKESEIKFDRKIKDWNWYDFILHISDNISENVLNKLISVGALKFLDSDSFNK